MAKANLVERLISTGTNWSFAGEFPAYIKARWPPWQHSDHTSDELAALQEQYNELLQLTDNPIYRAYALKCWQADNLSTAPEVEETPSFFYKIFDGRGKSMSRLADEAVQSILNAWVPNFVEEDIAQFDTAISVAEKSAFGTLERDPNKMRHLMLLSKFYLKKYARSHEKTDLDSAIDAGKRAIAAADEANIPVGSSIRYKVVTHLVHTLSQSSEVESQHLELAIALRQEMSDSNYASCAQALGPSFRAENLNILAIMLTKRYTRDKNLNDLHIAVRALFEAADLATTTGDKLSEAGFLSNLADKMMFISGEADEKGYLDCAHFFARRAANLAPSDNLDLHLLTQTALGNILLRMFLVSGNFKHIDEAIDINTKLIETAPKDHENYALYLTNMGNCLAVRFERNQVKDDIDRAIDILTECLLLTKKQADRERLPQRTNSLACRYGQRYAAYNDLEDLQKAIDMSQDALALKETPDNLHNLALWYVWRFRNKEAKDDVQELDQAITYIKKALTMLPKNHASKREFSNTLCDVLLLRYERVSDNVTDLNEAIELVHTTIEGDDSFYASGRKFNLSRMYLHRYRKSQESKDQLDALSCLKDALKAPNSPPFHRVSAVRDALPSLAEYTAGDVKEQYALLSGAVKLLQNVATRALAHTDQQNTLRRFSGLPSRAAAVAFQAGVAPADALKMIEHGRGVISTLHMALRSDLRKLKQVYPQAAAQFIECRRTLLQLSATTSAISGTPSTPSGVLPNNISTARSKADKDFDQAIKKIQSLPGWQNFLLPPNADDFMRAARLSDSTIVVINVDELRCDALIVEPSQIRFLPLPQLKITDIAKHAKRLSSKRSLEWLWDTLAKPVLEKGLGIRTPCISTDMKDWKRICWVPTRQLCDFPIHAAGYHYDFSGDSVLDRVISTYSPSIKALLNLVDRKAATAEPDPSVATVQSQTALLIGMKHTPGQVSLPNAALEIDKLEVLLQPHAEAPLNIKTIKLSGPAEKDVIPHLPSTSIFHFAGHGKADKLDPSKSCLLLSNGTSDPLTVTDIVVGTGDVDSPYSTPALLAYLSACETGRVDVDALDDESIHLMGAFMLAGFRHVIGSLWSVSDRYSVDVATDVYKCILENGLDDKAFAWALHLAVKRLRGGFTTSLGRLEIAAKHSPFIVMDVVPVDFDTESPLDDVRSPDLWAAYIQMGI